MQIQRQKDSVFLPLVKIAPAEILTYQSPKYFLRKFTQNLLFIKIICLAKNFKFL